MVTDNQVRILMKLVNQEKLLKTAAAKAGMSEKTARKYRKSGKLPSQCKVVHDWRTRPDPLDQEDWRWVEEVLENNDGIEAKTLFEVLQREHPGTPARTPRQIPGWAITHVPAAGEAMAGFERAWQ